MLPTTGARGRSTFLLCFSKIASEDSSRVEWGGIPHSGSRTSAFRHLRSECEHGLQTFIVMFSLLMKKSVSTVEGWFI